MLGTAKQNLETSPALHTRASAYLCFARLFREAPTPALLQQLREHGVLAHVEDAQWFNQAEAIAVEYARLFAVPGEHAVQPYESAYCDTLTIDTSTACSSYFASEPPPTGLTGFLYGPSAVAVCNAYRRAGFELDPARHVLPDHLAIELEFMGRLLGRGECEAAKVFFSEHLGRWVCRCLEDMRQRTATGFYRVVADAAGAFLQQEQRLFLDPELEHAYSRAKGR